MIWPWMTCFDPEWPAEMTQFRFDSVHKLKCHSYSTRYPEWQEWPAEMTHKLKCFIQSRYQDNDKVQWWFDPEWPGNDPVFWFSSFEMFHDSQDDLTCDFRQNDKVQWCFDPMNDLLKWPSSVLIQFINWNVSYSQDIKTMIRYSDDLTLEWPALTLNDLLKWPSSVLIQFINWNVSYSQDIKTMIRYSDDLTLNDLLWPWMTCWNDPVPFWFSS